MSLLTNSAKFSFVSGSQNLQADTFAVVSFKGYEALSQVYNFEIKLVTGNLGIDLGEVLSSSATFTIHRVGDDVVINGVLANLEEISENGPYRFYKALFVPKLWWLTLARSNQVFLGHAIQEQSGEGFVETVLADSQVGLGTQDYEFRLMSTYSEIEYVSQYSESHFNFISRWLEKEGIYYFFERTADSEKAVFVDSYTEHADLAQSASLSYSPASGLGSDTEIIASFIGRHQQLPRNVNLKDYNYEKPIEVTGQMEVDPSGIGEVYLYGENFATDTEGERLAGIRAEEFRCRKKLYIGESNIPFIQPGYTFTLQGHFRTENNDRKYLIVDVTHEGSQTGYLVSGITSGLSGSEKDQTFYRNSFTVIPRDTQFRAERRAEKPRIFGTMNAKIDAAQNGDYAELDDQGRYKVKLPFDLVTTRTDGKNSYYVRMMQPYSGTSDGGFHLPLHKGAEVLLSFINGDPDRPVIAGAVPNPDTPSVVKDDSQQYGKIKTDGGNYIEFGDTADSKYTEIFSPCGNSTVRCGKSSDGKSTGVSIKSDGDWYSEVGSNASIKIVGNTAELFIGVKESLFLGAKLDLAIALAAAFKLSAEFNFTLGGSRSYAYPDGWHVNLPKKEEITMQDIETKVNDMQTILKDEINTTVGNKISTTKTAIETIIQDKIKSVQKEVNLSNTKIDALSKEIKSVDKEIKAANTELKTVKSEISQTNNQIENVNTHLGMVRSSIKEAKTNICKHQTCLEQISTHVKKVGFKVEQGQIMIT